MKLRLFVAAAALVAITAACGTGNSSSPAAIGNPSAPAGAIHVSLLDFSITPSTLNVPSGTVTFYVTNDGKTPHNFNVRSPRGPIGQHIDIVARSKDLTPGQSDVVTAKFAAGTYTFYCAFAGHESLGMIGDLTVT